MILLGKFSETIGVGDSLKDNFDKSKKCVAIADDYAIEFASFIDKKYYQHKYDNNKYAESEEDFTYGKTYSIKQLLEIFKKEKGL
jgi:hypothetical protein